MVISISGGTGFIGRALIERLLEAGHSLRVTGRRAPHRLPPRTAFWCWDATSSEPPCDWLEGSDAVVHLAGETLAQRWTAEAKARIRASRIEGTKRLVGALARCDKRPAVLVCASAVGYYGSRGDEWLVESSPAGKGFLAELVRDWEREALAAVALGMRVVCLRTGMVLGRDGGALVRLLPPFRVGLGARLGSGKQWVSWIHLDDVAGLVLFALESAQLSGPVNAVAPAPVTNAQFTQTLARLLRRPALLRLPAFALRLFLGEMACVLLDSQRVYPQAALAAGFGFRWPELEPALADVLGAKAAGAS